MLQYSQMSNDVQFQSVAEVDNFAESTNSSLNYLILEALGIGRFCLLLYKHFHSAFVFVCDINISVSVRFCKLSTALNCDLWNLSWN